MNETQSIRLGSRDSLLALTQTRYVMALLQEASVPFVLDPSIQTFKTHGDRFLDAPITELGGVQGVFVKELEEALLNGEIDLAVHSLKDMPSQLPSGLSLFPIGQRADSRDALLISPCMSESLLEHGKNSFFRIPKGCVVGTSSLRRIAQLKMLRPDLDYQPIRGNLQTRYEKMKAGSYDAIVLAAAGVQRLGWEDRIAYLFDPLEEVVPPVGQGILAVEFCSNNAALSVGMSIHTDDMTRTAFIAERGFQRAMAAGCQTPMGGYAKPIRENILSGAELMFHFVGVLLDMRGGRSLRWESSFCASEATLVGERAAEAILSQGGDAIRDQYRS